MDPDPEPSHDRDGRARGGPKELMSTTFEANANDAMGMGAIDASIYVKGW